MELNDRIAVFKEWFPPIVQDVDRIVDDLEEIGFFTAPASTKYHGNYEGGLFNHSLEVMMCLKKLTEKMELKWYSPRSPYIIGLFHDLCKCDQYILNEDGTYSYNKNLTLNGHGEKSIIIVQQILEAPLTEEEILCIRWHMGAFDDKENWNSYGLAIEKYPNVLWTHTADMMASRIMGV